MKNRVKTPILLLLLLSGVILSAQTPRRRMTPVDTPATGTQAVNETRNDTSRINAQIRARSTAYINDKGFTVYVDTITGDEWTDSAAMRSIPKMEFPLLDALAFGVDLWDPLMRAFGQKYGLAGVWAELSLHNRYKPVIEAGLGTASVSPSGMNYTYRSGVNPYFRIGINYNFLYNSNPDYSIFAGIRYGLSRTSFSVDNVNLVSDYWDTDLTIDVPRQNVTVGWFEFLLGLRVKIAGPVSAGWDVRYRSRLHESRAPYGRPWYIPGFGSRNNPISASLSIIYTLPLGRSATTRPDLPVVSDLPEPSGPTEPSEPSDITQ